MHNYQEKLTAHCKQEMPGHCIMDIFNKWFEQTADCAF
jgi:hypothetical protein